MPYSVRLPRSGRIIPFPDDVDKEEARLALIDRFPEEFPDYKPDEGFIPGLQSGWETLKGVPSSIQAGIGGLSGDQRQFEAGIEGVDEAEIARRQALPRPITAFEHEGQTGPSVERTYEEEGFFPAASQAMTFAGQELGRQIPQMGAAYGANLLGRGPGAKLVAGVLGKALPALRIGAAWAPHPLLKLALGATAGIATMAAQSFAEMVAADRAEGAATPEEFEFARKALYSGPIGAMDYIFVGLTSPAGSSIRNAATKTLRKTIGDKAIAAGSEFFTETIQEVLFRAERGEELSPFATDKAKTEFLELMASVAPTALTFAGGSAAYDRIDAARSRRIFDKATELETQKREERESQRVRSIAEDEARATAEAEQELEARNRWIAGVGAQIDTEVEAFGGTIAPTHKEITDLADAKNINWGDDKKANEAFMAFTHRMSNGEAVHLDQLDPQENDTPDVAANKEQARKKIFSVLDRMQRQEEKSDLSMFSEAEYRRAVEGIRNSSKSKREHIDEDGGWPIRESLDPLFRSQKDKDTNRIGNRVARSIIQEMRRRGDAEIVTSKTKPSKKGEKPRTRRPTRFVDKPYNEDEYIAILGEARRRGLLTQDAVTAALRPRPRSYDPSLYEKILADARKRGDVDKRTRRVIPTSAQTLRGRPGSQIVASGPVVEPVGEGQPMKRGWIVTQNGERKRGFTTRGNKGSKNEGTSRGYIGAREAEGETGFQENKVGVEGFAVVDEGNLEDGTPYREVLDFFTDEQDASNFAGAIESERNIPNPMVERVKQEKAAKKESLWKQLRDIPGYAEYLEKKTLDEIKNARSARSGTPLTPEEELRRSAVIQQMKEYLDAIGISDVVSPRVEKVLTDQYELARFEVELRKIAIALDKMDPNWTQAQRREYVREQLDHEILHAIVELDLIEESEWDILVNKAATQKIPKFILNESNKRIKAQNEGVTDPKEKLKKLDPKSTFLDLVSRKDYHVSHRPEESVAEMLRAYGKDKRVLNGRPEHVGEKVYKIFEKLSNWSRDMGYVSASDIFDDIIDGTVGNRSRDEIRTFRLTRDLTRMATPKAAGEERERDLKLRKKPTKKDAYDPESPVPKKGDLGTRKNVEVFKNTEQFNNFFKDSVVRDADGNLVPLAHATGVKRSDLLGRIAEEEAVFQGRDFHDIESFNPWTHFGTPESAEDRIRDLSRGLELEIPSSPYYPEVGSVEDVGEGARYYPVYLNIKNPLEMEDVGAWHSANNVLHGIVNSLNRGRSIGDPHPLLKGSDFLRLHELGGTYDHVTGNALKLEDIQSWLESNGYDGIAYENTHEDVGSQSYIIFNPEQAKTRWNMSPTLSKKLLRNTEKFKNAEDLEKAEDVADFITRGGKVDADNAAIAQLMAANMYEGDLTEVTVRELVQNSFDGVKGAEHIGLIDPGSAKIAVLYDTDNRLVTVVDNGIGMSPDVLDEAFFRIGGTDKSDLPPHMRSGGLGLAKLAFLLGSEGVKVDTVDRNGIRSIVETNREEIQRAIEGEEGAFQIRQSKSRTDLASGTIVTVKIPRKMIEAKTGSELDISFPRPDPWNEQKGPMGTKVMSYPLVGDIEVVEAYIGNAVNSIDPVTVDPDGGFIAADESWVGHPVSKPIPEEIRQYVTDDGTQAAKEEARNAPEFLLERQDRISNFVPGAGSGYYKVIRSFAGRMGGDKEQFVGNKFDENRWPKFATAKYDWGSIDIYMSTEREEPDYTGNQVGNIFILSSGLYQFDKYPAGLQEAEVPYNVILDVKSDVDTKSDAYPFRMDREKFSNYVANDIVSLKKYLEQFAANDASEENRKNFSDKVLNVRDFKSAFEDTATDTTIDTTSGSDPRILGSDYFRGSRSGRERAADSSFDIDRPLLNVPLINRDSLNIKRVDAEIIDTYHNNTNWDPAATEEGRNFIREIAGLVRDFRNELQKIPHEGTGPALSAEIGSEDSYNAPKYDGLRADRLGKYTSGVSIDKSESNRQSNYFGIHVFSPFNALYVNPFVSRAENIKGRVAEFFHTLQHEAVHLQRRGHNESFAGGIGEIAREVSEYGIERRIVEKIEDVFSRNWDLYERLRAEYDDGSTTNTGKSLRGDAYPMVKPKREGIPAGLDRRRVGSEGTGREEARGLGRGEIPGREDDRSRSGPSALDVIHANLPKPDRSETKRNTERFTRAAKDSSKAGFVYPGENLSFPGAFGNMPLADGESNVFDLVSAPAPAVPSLQRFVNTLTPSNYQKIDRKFADGIDELRNIVNGQVNETGTGVERVISDIIDMGFPSPSETKGASSFVLKVLKKANGKLLGTTSVSVKPSPTKTQYENLADDLNRIMSDVGAIYASSLSSRSGFNAPSSGVSSFLSKYAQDPRFSDSIETFFPQGTNWDSSALSGNDRFFHDTSTRYLGLMKNPGEDGVNAQTSFREAFSGPVSSTSAASVYKNFASAITSRAFADQVRSKSFKPQQPMYRGGSSSSIRGVSPGDVINISGFSEFTSNPDEAVAYAVSEDPSINPVIYRVNRWGPQSSGVYRNIDNTDSHFLSGPIKIDNISTESIGDREFTIVDGEHLTPTVVVGPDYINKKSANVYRPGMEPGQASEISERIQSGFISRVSPNADDRAIGIAKGQIDGDKLKPGVKSNYRLNAKQNTSAFNAEDRALASVVRRMSADPGHRTWGEKILDAMNWENWLGVRDEADKNQLFTRFRAASLDTWAAAVKLDRRVQDIYGDRFLYADTSASSSLYLSDRSAGVMEALMTMGYLTYDGGFLHAVPMQVKLHRSDKRYDKNNGSIEGGLIEILRPLFQEGGLISKNNILREWQAYRSLVKEARLSKTTDKSGKPVYKYLISDVNDRKKAADLLRKYPVFETVNENYEVWNSHLVKTMVDTGVITQDMGQVWIDFGDYIPFYRQLDGTSDSDFEKQVSNIFDSEYRRKDPTSINIPSKMFNSIAGAKAPKKIKGGVDPFMDPLEGIAKNAYAAVVAANKNVAAQRLTRNALLFGDEIVAEVPNSQDYPAAVTIRYEGEDRHFVWKDVPLYNIMHGVLNADLPYMDIIGGPSAMLRAGVTRSPVFIIKNLLRDSLSAWITSGFKGTDPITAVLRTLKNFSEGGYTEEALLKKGTPAWKGLKAAGVASGFGFGRDVKDFGKEMHKRLREIGINPGANNHIAAPFKWMWNLAGDVSTKSDAASRMSVYEDVLERTGNEAEAVFQALEVINFSRRGNSVLAKIMTAGFPFMNARYQGMDVLYRSARGRHAADRSLAGAQIISKMLSRASMLLSMNLIYYMMVRDEEWYTGLSDYVKYNNYVIKHPLSDKPFLFPIPFELGILLKMIPELILASTYGDREWEEAWSATRDAVSATFGGTVMGVVPNPADMQWVKPINEIRSNYSVMTGRELFPKQYDTMDPRQMTRRNTTEVAKLISEAFGGHGGKWASPIAIEKLIGGYTGTVGMWTLHAVNAAYMSNADPSERREEKRWDQNDFIGSLLGAPVKDGVSLGRGYVERLNQLKEESYRVYGRFNDLLEEGRKKEAREYYEENKKAYLDRLSIDRALTAVNNLKEMQDQIRRMEGSRAWKAQRIEVLQMEINRIARPFSQKNLRQRSI